METLKHYNEFVDAVENVRNTEKNFRELMGILRSTCDVAELVIVDIESEFEYILSQYKASLISEYNLECDVVKFKEQIEKLNEIVFGGKELT